MIRRLKTKDLKSFLQYCSQKDKYEDFYITNNNEKLFLSDVNVAKKVFNDCIKRGDICLVSEERDEIIGILILTGFINKSDRKDLKIFAGTQKTVDDLIKSLNWYHNCNLHIKLKKENPVTEVLLGTRTFNRFFKQNLNTRRHKGYGFKVNTENKGSEVLLFRNFNPNFKYNKKEVKQ